MFSIWPKRIMRLLKANDLRLSMGDPRTWQNSSLSTISFSPFSKDLMARKCGWYDCWDNLVYTLFNKFFLSNSVANLDIITIIGSQAFVIDLKTDGADFTKPSSQISWPPGVVCKTTSPRPSVWPHRDSDWVEIEGEGSLWTLVRFRRQ